MSAATSFIVTTSVSGQTRTQLWDPESPLALGHPLRWIAERTQNGVRIRNLALSPGKLVDGSLCEIPQQQLQKGAEIRLPGTGGVSFSIRPASLQAPAFGSRRGDRLSIYACNGAWVMASALFDKTYQARGRVGDKHVAIFAMSEQGGQYAFDIQADGVSFRAANQAPRPLPKGQPAKFSQAELVDAVLEHGSRSWRFGLSDTVTLPEPKHVPVDAETTWFRKVMGYTMTAFGALLVVAWIMPKPKPQTAELIPAQFAKVILSKPAEQVKKAEAQPQAQAVPEKVAKAAVVQAFRNKALSNAVSGLLKGGMTNLLAQSDFVAGKSADARKSFDSKSQVLASNGPATGVSANTNQAVTAVGGDAKGGYAKGERAAVKGQGAAFVSMDIAGVAVDEGLTKDEVGEVIHKHLSEVRYCYESAMVRTPDIEGKLMVGFTIGGNGVVKSTEIKSSTVPDPRLDDCILRRLTTWKFPQPRGGIDVTVAYPFIFKTLGR
jgi:TonB family protein